jgi:hypothetical protein
VMLLIAKNISDIIPHQHTICKAYFYEQILAIKSYIYIYIYIYTPTKCSHVT